MSRTDANGSISVAARIFRWAAAAAAGLSMAAPEAKADLAGPFPELHTSLPAPTHIVITGLAISLAASVLGLRLLRRGKCTRLQMNVVLFLLGAVTAGLAVYSQKVRQKYAAEVKQTQESGPNRQYLDVDAELNRAQHQQTPDGPDNSPPTVDLPGIDPPGIDPPGIDPPAVDPPAVDPPAVDPPAVDPSAVDPPTVDPAN
ncbi:MAG: hypothetical protein KDB14_00650 [Planctomycetales bacterium]|nr:hypothetical protein [Planctomycetales bacterium]